VAGRAGPAVFTAVPKLIRLTGFVQVGQIGTAFKPPNFPQIFQIASGYLKTVENTAFF
jgi:hypothetical protein